MTSARLHTDGVHSEATPTESMITNEDVEHTRRYIVTEGGRAYPLDTRKAIDAYRDAGKEPVTHTDWTDLDERIEATRTRSTYLCRVMGCNREIPMAGYCSDHQGSMSQKVRERRPVPWSRVLYFLAAAVGVIAALFLLAGCSSEPAKPDNRPVAVAQSEEINMGRKMSGQILLLPTGERVLVVQRTFSQGGSPEQWGVAISTVLLPEIKAEGGK